MNTISSISNGESFHRCGPPKQSERLPVAVSVPEERRGRGTALGAVVECFVAFSTKFPSVAPGLASPANIRVVPQRVALPVGPQPPD